MNDPENMYDDGTCCAGSLRMKAMEQQEQTWINQVADLEAELTRLRAALQAIADRQPTQHVGDAHRGTMHDDRKSAYYVGVFDGRKDGLFEAAEMARTALGGGT